MYEFDVEKDNRGCIWISCEEPYTSGIQKNRVASIERNDKSDTWDIEISGGKTLGVNSISLSLVINGQTEEEMINLVKGFMMFTQVSLYWQ